jgi:hypothetical protein
MNILIIIIAVLLLAAQRNGGTGGGGGGGGTPPPPETCSDSKFARMQAYIYGLKRMYGSYVNLQARNPMLAAVLEREYGDCRGWNNW